MKANGSFPCRCLAGIALLFAGAALSAAPLTWFPGPTLYYPRSGAATTVVSSGKNLLVGGDATVVQELAATNIAWTYLNALSSIAIAPGVAGNGDPITVYGGSDRANSTSAVIAYSPSGDVTPLLASMSVARSYLGYAPDKNGNAYAFGGLDASGNPLASGERYNPDRDTWTNIASLPTALYDFPAVFNRTNYIYLFGGLTDTASGIETATVWRYSVSGNSWSNMTSMPVAVAGSAATLGPDGKIYVVGGTSGGVATAVVQVYNPAADSWAIATPLPEALSLAAMSVDSLGRLIVMGGMDINGNDVSDVWRSQQFNVPDSAPVLTQLPSTSAIYLVAYASSINATGSPPPTYSLVSGPAGMQVDYYTGAITWTPQGLDQIGTNQVTVQAANYAGASNWNFNIIVPNPPPTKVSNLAVISVTETSVTLGWDPESPAVGPTIFTVAFGHPWHDPRGSGGGINYQAVGSTTSTNFTIYSLQPSTSYILGVAPTAPGGTNGYADISITTTGPKPPSNLRVTGITSTSISLAWDPSPGPVPITRYEVLGWIGGLFPTIGYGANITNTAATITGLTPGTYEEWSVRAYDAGGNVSGFAPGIYVVNPVPAAASLSTVAPSTSGGFQITASEGDSSLQTVLILATTNPADPSSWVPIGSLLPITNPFTFTDTNASLFPMRFYRVVSP